MSYESLLAAGIIRPHRFNNDELRVYIEEMFVVIDRYLEDANASGISFDAHYSFAYAAARVAAEIMMFSEGFRPGTAVGNHAAVFIFLTDMEDGDWAKDAKYFDRARQKRNIIEYRRAGIATESQVQELADVSAVFLVRVRDWLAKHHPELVPNPPSPPEHP